MPEKLSKSEPAHRMFAAFHEHNVPMKRSMCEELRFLIQNKTIQGSKPIKDILDNEEAKKHCSKQLLHSIQLVTDTEEEEEHEEETEPVLPPLPRQDAGMVEVEVEEVEEVDDDNIYLERVRCDTIIQLCKNGIYIIEGITNDDNMNQLKQVKAILNMVSEITFRRYYL